MLSVPDYFFNLSSPHLEYASAVWSPYTKENIGKIEKVQRRAARWISNDYSTYSSVTDMLSNLGWRSLENRRIDARFTMFYKIVNTASVIFWAPWSIHSPHALSLLQTNSYICLLLHVFTPTPMSVVLWNKLPTDLVLVSDLDFFKKKSQ